MHHAGEDAGWDANKRKLYEFVVRHFLAACSRDAVGFETQVLVDLAGAEPEGGKGRGEGGREGERVAREGERTPWGAEQQALIKEGPGSR